MTKAGVYDSDHGSLCKSEFICRLLPSRPMGQTGYYSAISDVLTVSLLLTVGVFACHDSLWTIKLVPFYSLSFVLHNHGIFCKFYRDLSETSGSRVKKANLMNIVTSYWSPTTTKYVCIWCLCYPSVMNAHVCYTPKAAQCTQRVGVLVYHRGGPCVTCVTAFYHALTVVCDADA